MCFSRDYAKHMHDTTKIPDWKKEHDRLKIECRQFIKSKKISYLNETETIGKSNPKKLWKRLSDFLPKINSKSIPKKMTSEDFNTYFSNVAPDIDKQFPNDTDNFEWKGSDCKNTFVFAPFTVEKIQQELLNLDNSPNLDILGMDRKLLRLSAPIVSDSLCKIFNASI